MTSRSKTLLKRLPSERDTAYKRTSRWIYLSLLLCWAAAYPSLSILNGKRPSEFFRVVFFFAVFTRPHVVISLVAVTLTLYAAIHRTQIQIQRLQHWGSLQPRSTQAAREGISSRKAALQILWALFWISFAALGFCGFGWEPYLTDMAGWRASCMMILFAGCFTAVFWQMILPQED